jgi:transcription elongation factor
MNEHLRDRILRKLDTLNDERGYQILDYAEFLESRYAERQAPGGNPFSRFTEAVEDRLRAGRVSASTITEAVGLMNRAANVLNGALAAGRSVANDIVSATRTPGSAPGQTPTPSSTPTQPSNGTSASTEASSPARETKIPGSGEEKL